MYIDRYLFLEKTHSQAHVLNMEQMEIFFTEFGFKSNGLEPTNQHIVMLLFIAVLLLITFN